MKFGVIGISYQKTSIQKREGASFSDTQKLQLYDELLDSKILQAMSVTTCNRSELYIVYEEKHQLHQAITLFVKMAKTIAREDVFVKTGKEALLYLFEVCGGYHSMILGEDQILGQMKTAYAFANQAGACRKELHRILQTCFSCIKQIKQTYRISEISTSIAYLAYTYLTQQTTLQGKKILLIGSGEMAQLMLMYLKDVKADLWLCSRTLAHASKLQEGKEKLPIVPFEERYSCIKDCDMIISATASPHVIIKKEAYPLTEKEQYLMDLASPRDIDETIKDENHHLCNLDDLQIIADKHSKERQKRMRLAYGDMVQRVDSLMEWLCHVQVDKAIASLQTYSKQQAQHTYELLKQKLSLQPHEERMMKKVLETSFLRMVKEPILSLKQLQEEDQEQYAAMVEQLFLKEDDICDIS